jgi:CBS domain containing-hemolysin-like protein
VQKNLFRLRVTRVKDAMTPRTVIFSLPECTTVAEFFHDHEPDHIEGFVLRRARKMGLDIDAEKAPDKAQEVNRIDGL